MKIDPSLLGKAPQVEAATSFTDGSISGWRLQLPGGHPLATAAVADGRVYIGGGFGSYDFFALDAATGQLIWHYQTEDDGPTAAVLAEDFVLFNTESCELEVLSTAGERVWKKWLGDPLLSMPAAIGDRVFMAFPDSNGDRRHYLACFGLRNGEEHWRQPIPGEIITCPVLVEDAVYLTTLDGTLACYAQQDGQPRWQEPRNATSAPAIWRSRCYFSERRETSRGTAAQQTEHLASKYSAPGTPTDMFLETIIDADYLDHVKRQRGSPRYATEELHDAHVGFAAHKGDSKMDQALNNLGKAHVSAVWAYQGSKPFIAYGRMYSGLGDTVYAANPETRDVLWKQKVREGTEELLDNWLTPPAIVNGKLFIGTMDGRVICLSAETGAKLWSVSVGEPVLFQPTVAQGSIFVSTAGGSLFCLRTGEPADDGWNMWGATAAHNGRPHS